MKRALALVAESFPLRAGLALAIWVSLFLYAGRPIRVAAAAGEWEPAAAWGAVVLLSLMSLLPFLVGRAVSDSLRRALAWIGYATMSLFSMLLVLVIAVDVLDALSTAVAWMFATVSQPLPWASPSPLTISRVALGAGAALTLLGLVQARVPRVRRVAVPVDDLPRALEGFRIVQLSDLHVGPTIRDGFVRCLVERVNRLEADAVAITGDLVDGTVDDLREAIAPLAGLQSDAGTFWVTGNHEYYWRAGDWVRELDRLGLTFLHNEHRVVRRGDAAVVFAGITDPAGRDGHRPDLEAALDGVPADAVTILLAHRPQAVERASRRGIHLQLSGHTHGGQFFPFNLLIRWFQPVVAGLHRVGASWLYVSRGTGYWGPPSRLGVGGEITVIELTRA